MMRSRLLPDHRALYERSVGMGTTLRAVLAVLVLVLAPHTCHADFILQLSSPSDLNKLTPGQLVTIRVGLTGLNAGDRLDFLAATVAFDGDLLGTPTIAPGPIIPDLSGFAPGESKGVADGLYDTLFAISGTPISTNGVFYSFDVTVLGAGSGMIAFDLVASSGSDASGVPLSDVTAGSALTISSVPEPPSWLLCGLGMLGIIGFREAKLKLVGWWGAGRSRASTGSRLFTASE